MVVVNCPRCGRQASLDVSGSQASCLTCQLVWTVGSPLVVPPPLPPARMPKPKRPATKGLITKVTFGTIGVLGAVLIAALILHEGYGIGPDPRQIIPGRLPPIIPKPSLALSAPQKAVRQYILKNANKPESVWFEEWHDAIPIRKITFYPKGFPKSATMVVHVIYRMTVPLLGELRNDNLYYLDGNEITAIDSRRASDDFDKTLERYYGKP